MRKIFTLLYIYMGDLVMQGGNTTALQEEGLLGPSCGLHILPESDGFSLWVCWVLSVFFLRLLGSFHVLSKPTVSLLESAWFSMFSSFCWVLSMFFLSLLSFLYVLRESTGFSPCSSWVYWVLSVTLFCVVFSICPSVCWVFFKHLLGFLHIPHEFSGFSKHSSLVFAGFSPSSPWICRVL